MSFCFFCDAHLWCQFSRTLLQYFQRYRLFSILPLFSSKKYDIITDLICITEKRQYLLNAKNISKRKMSFFCILKGLSEKHRLFSCHKHFNNVTKQLESSRTLRGSLAKMSLVISVEHSQIPARGWPVYSSVYCLIFNLWHLSGGIYNYF